jgi:multidrug resistance efflux pump
VKITLDKGPLAGRLRPGMSVVPTINTKEAADDSRQRIASQ